MTRTQEKTRTKANLSQVVEHLNRMIADNIVYYQKVRHYHWNIIGDQFFPLHAVFEQEYETTSEVIDLLAERVRALGQIPLHTLDAALSATNLEEDEAVPVQKEMVRRAANDLARMVAEMNNIHQVMEEANDYGSTNMIEDLIEKTEKRIWMLRSFLGEPIRT
ncbi:MAG TPA: DNA starvation/stationary phase protection protein [Anaerolineaceae bacterium]|nr:DNA starvation/stationary phase protection protein [Anaerolineaceae bacterium]